MYELAAPGWFESVNGIEVVRLPLSDAMVDKAGEFYAHHGIEWHRQQGPGGDITGTQNARGYPICNWNVDDDGVVRQYLDVRLAAWHGDSVSHYAYGIEHSGFKGTPCTAKQLRSSEALSAALVEYADDQYGEAIDLEWLPRISLANYQTARGFFNHDAVDDGPLNENGHTDGLEGESTTEYLRNVGSLLLANPPPAPAFGGELLRVGVNAADVIVWKRRMSGKGLFRRTGENDGPHYGTAIARATRTFQKRRGLAVDGVVGPKTWAAAWR